MIQVYLEVNNEWVLQKIELLPTNTPTKDETLETFSFVMAANNDKEPIKPMTRVKVAFDNTNITLFDVITDSVELFSLNPQKYKHTITCIQNTRRLSKYLVRNSNFTQPANLYKKSNCGVCQSINESGNLFRFNTSDIPQSELKGLTLTGLEKAKNYYLEIDLDIAVGGNGVTGYIWSPKFHTLEEINDYFNSNITMEDIYINATIDGTGTARRVFDPSEIGATEWRFNEKMLFNSDGKDEIDSLFSGGYKAVYLSTEFSNNAFGKLFTGTFDMTGDKYPVFIGINIRLIAEVYYYSVADVIELLLERQKNNTNTNYHSALFRLPLRQENVELYDLLHNTVAPNFAFTQATMYDCLMDIFSLFDAIFTLDNNNVLGIEYYNDNRAEKITPKLSGVQYAISEDKYNNGLVAHYQDAYIKEMFPSVENKFAPVRSSQFGVPSEEDHYFIVPYPIRQIDKMTILVSGITVSTYETGSIRAITVTGEYILDISDYVVDQELWASLDVTLSQGTNNPSILIQSNTLYFASGDNKIALGKLKQNATNQYYAILWNAMICSLLTRYGTNASGNANWAIGNPVSEDWKNVKCQLTYFAKTDGRLKVEGIENKFGGEMIINQNQGAIDINKLGLSLFGSSLKLGEPTFNATHVISSLEDRIRTGQIYVDENDNYWVANIVNYSFIDSTHLRGKVQFVKNFNNLALRTRINREKRMSNISTALVVKSESNIVEYVYYSTTNVGGVNNGYIDFDMFIDGLYQTFTKEADEDKEINKVDYAYFTCSEIENEKAYLPCLIYGAGNCLCFEMAYEHPMSAGNRTKIESGWFGNNEYYTKAVKYTDKNGFVENATIKVIDDESASRDFDNDFPIVNPSSENVFISIPNLVLKKQPNEIFALNYELCFLPDVKNRDFIGSQLLNDNFFTGRTVPKKVALCLMSAESSVMDEILVESDYFAKYPVVAINKGNNYIEFDFGTLDPEDIVDTVSFAIVDENNNVLFASNSATIVDNPIKIYFGIKHSRI